MAQDLGRNLEIMSYAEKEEVTRVLLNQVTQTADGIEVALEVELRGGITATSPASCPSPG